jgi:hypothetical protein
MLIAAINRGIRPILKSITEKQKKNTTLASSLYTIQMMFLSG